MMTTLICQGKKKVHPKLLHLMPALFAKAPAAKQSYQQSKEQQRARRKFSDKSMN